MCVILASQIRKKRLTVIFLKTYFNKTVECYATYYPIVPCRNNVTLLTVIPYHRQHLSDRQP
jgi:hypothetical protein